MSDTTEVRQVLQARFRAIDEAMARKDMRGIFSYSLPDFVDTHGKRVRSLEQLYAETHLLLRRVDGIVAESHITELTVEHEQAVVTLEEQWQIGFQLPQSPWLRWTRHLRIVCRAERRCVWVERSGGWFWQSAETLSTQVRLRLRRKD